MIFLPCLPQEMVPPHFFEPPNCNPDSRQRIKASCSRREAEGFGGARNKRAQVEEPQSQKAGTGVGVKGEGMGTEVALPLSLQELASFLQVTEGILRPSHRCMVQRWGMVVQGRHRIPGQVTGLSPAPSVYWSRFKAYITILCLQPWQGGQGTAAIDPS